LHGVLGEKQHSTEQKRGIVLVLLHFPRSLRQLLQGVDVAVLAVGEGKRSKRTRDEWS
jgi:hypothetical protein